MQLNARIVASVLILATPFAAAQAQSEPDPLFGDAPAAKAVLDCQADYARRFAKATLKPQASATEIATGAHAHCIGQFNAYLQSVFDDAKASRNARLLTDPQGLQEAYAGRMRDYAFAHTIDVYLTSATVP